MALRAPHGRAAELGIAPRVEVLPADELPPGLPGDARGSAPGDHDASGLFARGNKASSKGGRSRAGATRLARRMGLANVELDPAFAPYRRAAADFRRAHVATLARTVGGGFCGPAPASIVASAAWQLAASRYLFDSAAGDTEKMIAASKLANDSRQNLLAAHELCAREANPKQRAPENAIQRMEREIAELAERGSR